MADNLTDRGPADRARINLHEDYELRYWTKQLGVSEERLRAAVAAAGSSADAVREHLRHNKQ
jgi:hypothetical protein